ncbi:MAG: glycosyltransferase family 9 protein, partial [Blastocatellia bacterium]
TNLGVTGTALDAIDKKLAAETQRSGELIAVSVNSVVGLDGKQISTENTENNEKDTPFSFALVHPAAAFATKTWDTENFARTVEFLYEKGLASVAIAAKNEHEVLEKLAAASKVPLITLDDLALPEITALASRAKLFVGNDSGIAHIAAAVNTPSVVIFGSSNRDHWRPWTDAANEIVFQEFACQPCPGYECKEYGEPRCILSVTVDQVAAAIERVRIAADDQ